MQKCIVIVGHDCIDPSREGEFGDWCDNVYTPLMLNIPGLVKASCYEAAILSDPAGSLKEGDAKFLSLWEIENQDVDQTTRIVGLAVDAQQGQDHCTPLFVTSCQAIYRQIFGAYEKAPSPTGRRGSEAERCKYIFAVRGISADPSRESEFNDWYDNTHVPDIMQAPDFMRVTRYELAVNLRHDEARGAMPKFLALYELETDDIERTMRGMRIIGKGLREQGRMSLLFVSGGSNIYRQLTWSGLRRRNDYGRVSMPG